jgi:predicted nucleic acid-binding protein
VRAVVLDTGPIVGLLHHRDVHHGKAIDGIKRSAEQGRALVTAWEVVGEAFTLIRTRISGRGHSEQAMTVLRWAEESGVIIEQSGEADQRRAIEVIRFHRDLRLSYVDALLLAICERLGVEELLTVDGHLGAVRLASNLIVTRV